jgi:glutaredoxin-related protein
MIYGGILAVNKPVVYTLGDCPATRKLKEDWGKEGVEYEEKRVDQSQENLDEALKYGDMVPIIVYGDGRVEVGYQGMIG